MIYKRLLGWSIILSALSYQFARIANILKVSLVLLVALCTGCDHIPSKVYKIKTVDGEILNLYCPTVDRGRSKLTYSIDNQCRLVHD